MNFYTKIERYGNNILWVGYDNGKRFYKKVPYQPTFYVEDRKNAGDSPKHVSLIGDKPLKPVLCESMKGGTEFIERYKDVENMAMCGNTNYVAAFTYDKYPGKIQFDPSVINIFKFDIEVDISKKKPDMNLADNYITSIASKSSKSDLYYVFGTKDYDPYKTVTGIDPDKIVYVKCQSETELLRKFVDLWVSDYPDVVTGWNCELFDIAYLVKRIENVLGVSTVKRLSPWGHVREKTFEMFNKPQRTYVISGISIVDYMHAFKKFGYKYGTLQSYKLDHVASVVLGSNKLSYDEYGTLTELYNKNPQLYLDYNLYDTRLVEMMEEQAALLSLTFTVAYKSGVNYNDAFGTVGVWDTTIFRALMDQGRVPFVKKVSGETSGGITGGYVKSPHTGLKDWVVSFDLNSLYPHLMMQYNMSPETYQHNVAENVSQDMILNGDYKNSTKYAVAATGACFTKDRIGIIPEIIDSYYTERAEIKQEMLRAESKLESIKEEIERRQNQI